MNQIHTSYKTSKMLKEFLGESAPEPMDRGFYCENDNNELFHLRSGVYDGPYAYQLHDLLSKPFCEAFAEKDWHNYCGQIYAETLSESYWNGGMEAVEKALTEMMEGK